MTATVVVVGGGPAGQAAALTAARAGADVTLLERLSRLGGRLRTRKVPGFDVELDNGPHILMGCCSGAKAFLTALGLADHVEWQERFSIPYLERSGRRSELCSSGARAPFHIASSFLRIPWLSLPAKISIARAISQLYLEGHLEDRHDRTFASWLHQQGQDRATITRFWDPLVVSGLNAHVGEVSLGAAAFFYRRAILSHESAARIGFFRTPLSELFDRHTGTALASAGVDVRRSAAVEEVASGRVMMALGAEIAADRIILALDHRTTSRLLGIPIDLKVRPISTFHVLYDRPVLSERLVALQGSDLQWLYDASRQVPNLVQVIMSASDGYAKAPLAGLKTLVTDEIAAFIPEATPDRVLAFGVTREPRATFLAAPGPRTSFGPGEVYPGIHVAGAWNEGSWPSTIEGAVRSGVKAARQALWQLGLRRDIRGL